MGAVTAILRASEDPSIAACVLDSPFSNFRKVAEELVASKRINLPGFLTAIALQLVRGEVQSRADFDIDALSPIDMVPKIFVPVLFAVASEDTFVLKHHTEELCDAWGGSERSIMQVAGSHNSGRPHWFLDVAAAFLENRLSMADSLSQRLVECNPSKFGSMAVRHSPMEKMPLPRQVPIESVPVADDESAEAPQPTGLDAGHRTRCRPSDSMQQKLLPLEAECTRETVSTRATEEPSFQLAGGPGRPCGIAVL